MSYRTVLVASDLGSASDEAVRQGAAIAASHDARLVLLHVVPLYVPVTAGAISAIPIEAEVPAVIDQETELQGGREGLELQARRLGIEADSLEVASATGAVFPTILERAGGMAADLIVVASHRASALERVLLGSTADKVVRHAHCAVLLARPSPTSGKVLAATDLSEVSLPALRAADEEARRRSASLIAAHCLDLPAEMIGLGAADLAPMAPGPVETHPSLRHAAEKQLAVFLERAHVEAEVMIADGPPAPTIVAAATELAAELVVVGSTGKSGLRRAVLGSVAESIVRRAPCSVLLVRDRPERAAEQLPDPTTEEQMLFEAGAIPATA
jgi:nucleotide-binding universal stress UspA family protein